MPAPEWVGDVILELPIILLSLTLPSFSPASPSFNTWIARHSRKPSPKSGPVFRTRHQMRQKWRPIAGAYAGIGSWLQLSQVRGLLTPGYLGCVSSLVRGDRLGLAVGGWPGWKARGDRWLMMAWMLWIDSKWRATACETRRTLNRYIVHAHERVKQTLSVVVFLILTSSSNTSVTDLTFS